MSKTLKRWTLASAAMLVAVVLLLAVFQARTVAAPLAAAQDGEPDEQAVKEVIDAAVAWLLATHRNADGGFSSFSGGADLAPSDIGGTMDALWALSVTGAETGPTLAYLEANATELAAYVAQDGSTAGKAFLALVPIEDELGDFAGLNLATAVTAHMSPTGQYGVNTAFNQSLAMLGQAVAGQQVPEEAINWLISQQATEGDAIGSWDDGFGTPGNADSTALALAALRVSGLSQEDAPVAAGLDFLERAQLESGGWEYGTDFGENANSTSMVILALTILGEDISSEDSRWLKEGVSPLAALLTWQGESGAFQADFGEGPFDDFFSTVQTVPVLGFSQLLMSSRQGETPASQPPAEMTPTAMAVEPTATPEAAALAATPETPEAVAEASEADESVSSESEASVETERSETEAPIDDDEGSGSILLWVIGIGAVVAVAGLLWWVISRRKEA